VPFLKNHTKTTKERDEAGYIAFKVNENSKQ